MKVGHLNVTRPMWWDRTPLVVGKTSVVAGPAVSAVRWTYLVPSNRRAYCDYGFASVLRTTLATTPLQTLALITVRDTGGFDVGQVVYVNMIANSMGSGDRQVVGAYGVLTAGYSLQATSGDLSTGGVTELVVSAKLTEYDV